MNDAERRRQAEAAVRMQYPMLRGSAFEHMVAKRLGALAAAGMGAAGKAPARPDHSDQASAPYRFVPYTKDAIAPAQPEVVARGEAERPDIATPLPDGLCARIKLSWVAETPLLVGTKEEERDNATVVPMTIGSGDQATFIIPGATIRGAIRAVAEVAAAARLSQVNRNRLFGLRDFNHAALRGGQKLEQGALFPISDADNIKAGWLGVREEFRQGFAALARDGAAAGRLNEAFEIRPCRWHAVEADDIGTMPDIPWAWEHLQGKPKPSDGKAFSRLSLLVKYKVTRATKEGHIAPEARSYRFRAAGGNHGIKNRVVPDPGGDIEGHLVFSGPAPAGKRYEYVLQAPQNEPTTLTSASMLRFRTLNSQPVDDELRPLAGWDLALKAMIADSRMRIPVFFVGDLVKQPTSGAQAFFFGLTRYFKVPHRWSFEDVLNRSGVAEEVGRYTPRDLDMVEALFGFVREPSEPGGKTPPDQLALRGRVAFSAALLPASKGEVAAPVATVMVGPKPSFAPFYLAPDGKGFRDYSAPEAPRIAGRKRYPPRHPGAESRDALPAIQARLRRQVENVKEVQGGREPDPRMLSRLCFLLPHPDTTELRFESEVRLTNVTKEELGLVLWALTFGGGAEGAACRHMIGRAKPFGAGQMRVQVEDLRVVWNNGRSPKPLKSREVDAAPFLAAFKAWMDQALGDDKKRDARRDAIKALRATANPNMGAKWEQAGKLHTMIVAQRVGGTTVQYFQRLRDMVKPEFRGQRQQPRDPVQVEFLPIE